VTLRRALAWNVGTCVSMRREKSKRDAPARIRVPRRDTETDGSVVVMKPGNAGGAKGPDTPAEDASQPVRGGAGV
jgi:hypothetical protein